MFHILIENTKADIAQIQCSFSDIAHMVHSDGKKHCFWESHMMFLLKTRPDTRLPKSRAGGQEPYLRSTDHLGKSSEVKK